LPPEGTTAAPGNAPSPQDLAETSVTSDTALAIETRPQRWNWELLKAPFDRTLEQQAGEPLTTQQVENLRWFWFDGILAAVSEAFFLAYIPLFAVAYGATNQQVGWITALGNLAGAVALFPGARMLDRTGRPKRLVLWTGGGLGRLTLLLLAFIPLFSLPASAAILAIATLNALRSFMGNFGNPAWTALVAEIVPEFVRGRYFSLRNLTMGMATLVFSVFAGWLVHSGNAAALNDKFGFQMVFFLAFVSGMIGTAAFSRIVEPGGWERQGGGEHERTGLWAAARASTGFLGLVVSAFVWNLALQIAAPFFNVYLVTNLGADATMVGIAASASSLAGLGGQMLFGRVMDRRGAVWLQIVSGFPIVVLPTLWAFYTAPWQVVINNLFGGFFWAGYNLASFTLLLQLTPHRQRAHAVALYQTGVFASAVIGPLLGGYLADNVSFQLVFISSGFGRLIALGLFIWLTAWPLRKLARRAASAAQPV
jgi:MFS family permease